MKKLILLITIIPMVIFAQIRLDSQTDMNALSEKNDWNDTYLRNMGDFLTDRLTADTSNFLTFSGNLNFRYQTSAIDYPWNYDDHIWYSVVPELYGRAGENLTVYMKGLIQNAKEDVLDPNKRYWGDSFAGHWGDLEISKIQYKTDHFYVKAGRDYFMPGMSFSESILFSREQTAYDQLYAAYMNDYFEISSFYLRLNNTSEEGAVIRRHCNGHRLSVNLQDNGYIAVGELFLYGGENRGLEPAVFNPFLVYYGYQRNFKRIGSNTMFFMDAFYHYGNAFAYLEMILDDFMVDREVYSDLEATKYAANATVGYKNIIPDLSFQINYTRVNDRVYNKYMGPLYERWLYKGQPMGSYTGNNYWEVSPLLSYLSPRLKSELSYTYRVCGDEGLYSGYNYVHLDGHLGSDPLPDNYEYTEAFPYGDLSFYNIIKSRNYFTIGKNLILNLEASCIIEPYETLVADEYGNLIWPITEYSYHFNFAAGASFMLNR